MTYKHLGPSLDTPPDGVGPSASSWEGLPLMAAQDSLQAPEDCGDDVLRDFDVLESDDGQLILDMRPVKAPPAPAQATPRPTEATLLKPPATDDITVPSPAPAPSAMRPHQGVAWYAKVASRDFVRTGQYIDQKV